MRLVLIALLLVLAPVAALGAETERQTRPRQDAPTQQSRPTETEPGQTWNVQSFYPYKVQIEFYSQSSNHSWPGGGEAYALNDSAVHTFKLSCRRGEKICYGAWATGNADIYWGVGADNRHSCRNCCQTCGDGVSRSIQLTR